MSGKKPKEKESAVETPTVQEENAVAVQGPRMLPGMTSEDYQDGLREMLAGYDNLKFTKIVFPSSGSTVWDLEALGLGSAKEFSGIIIHDGPRKGWYKTSIDDGGEGNFPDCMSTDGEHGKSLNDMLQSPTGLCKDCPQAQWGSERKKGRGKDCSDRRFVFILLNSSDLLPVLLVVPPTSLGAMRDYVTELMRRGSYTYYQWAKFSLESDKNDDNIKFSKLVLCLGDSLTDPELDKVYALRKALMPNMQKETLKQEVQPDPTDIDTENKEGDTPY